MQLSSDVSPNTVKLPKAHPLTTEAISALKEIFPAHLHESIYLVGGAVRDHLSGKPLRDLDLVTALPPSCFLERGFQCIHGKSTAPIFLSTHPAFGKIEVTVLPAGQTVWENLPRRDFRCNAVLMALDGRMYDPLDGREDISRKILHPCSATILRDDPIRFFRALRFASHGWRLSSGFVDLLSARELRALEEGLARVPVQRFTKEMCIAMRGNDPCQYFSLMARFQTGRGYLPELFRMMDLPAGPSPHSRRKNLLEHSLDSLGRMATLTCDPDARLSSFFHDIGKLVTPQELLPWHPGHDRAGVAVARAMTERIRLPERTGRAIVAATRLHSLGGRWQELRRSTRITLAQSALKSGISGFLPLLVAADLDHEDALPGWELYRELVQLSPTGLGMDAPALSAMPERQRASLIMQYRHRRLKEMEKALSEKNRQGVIER